MNVPPCYVDKILLVAGLSHRDLSEANYAKIHSTAPRLASVTHDGSRWVSGNIAGRSIHASTRVQGGPGTAGSVTGEAGEGAGDERTPDEPLRARQEPGTQDGRPGRRLPG